LRKNKYIFFTNKMKLALIACLLAVSVISSEAYWGYGYGGLWGGMYGGMYGGLWSGYYGGLYGGYGYGYWGKRHTTVAPPQDLKNRTECVFLTTKGVLSCHGPEAMVECPANQTLLNSEQYEMFTIGLFADSETTLRYRIIPRRLDNSGWTKGEYTTGHFATLYSNGSECLGLDVIETECYQRLVSTVLSKSLRREKTFVDDETEPVVVIGDLMIAKDLPEDFVHEKRMEEREFEGKRRFEEENRKQYNFFRGERDLDMDRKSVNERDEKRWDDRETGFKRFDDRDVELKRQSVDERDEKRWDDRETGFKRFEEESRKRFEAEARKRFDERDEKRWERDAEDFKRYEERDSEWTRKSVDERDEKRWDERETGFKRFDDRDVELKRKSVEERDERTWALRDERDLEENQWTRKSEREWEEDGEVKRENMWTVKRAEGEYPYHPRDLSERAYY